MSELGGAFELELFEAVEPSGATAYATLSGRLLDGPQPVPNRLRLQREQGDCQLWIPDNPFCSDDCAADGALCTDEETCTAYPNAVDIGALTVEGLDGASYDISLVGKEYTGKTLSAQPCDAGASVSLGNDTLSLSGTCIDALQGVATDAVRVVSGEGSVLTWTAPPDPELSRMRIVLDISHHGGSKGEIDCDVPDTGSFTIPEPLVTDLVALGVAGFPAIVLRREAVTHADDHPDVALYLRSQVQRPVDTGFQTCTPEGTPCPDGVDCAALATCPAGTACDAQTLVCR